jgi:hypothetical protein
MPEGEAKPTGTAPTAAPGATPAAAPGAAPAAAPTAAPAAGRQHGATDVPTSGRSSGRSSSRPLATTDGCNQRHLVDQGKEVVVAHQLRARSCSADALGWANKSRIGDVVVLIARLGERVVRPPAVSYNVSPNALRSRWLFALSAPSTWPAPVRDSGGLQAPATNVPFSSTKPHSPP